jgi:hypothetical protein
VVTSPDELRSLSMEDTDTQTDQNKIKCSGIMKIINRVSSPQDDIAPRNWQSPVQT